MSNATKYLHTSAKESQAKLAVIRNAANLLEAVVAEIVQAIAESDGEKLLRDKREAVAVSTSYAQVPESLNQLRTVLFYGARVADSYNELSQWFAVLQGATTFAQWQECRSHIIRLRAVFYNSYHQISDYATNYANHLSELVVHYRRKLAKENKKLTPPVAVPKAVRKEAIRQYIMQFTLIPQTVASWDNHSLYSLARYNFDKYYLTCYGFNMSYKLWAQRMAIESINGRW